MLRLSTLPFTTNLPFDECDLCWAGQEGSPLWPDGGGYFAYSEERQIRIYGAKNPRQLPDLLGGGMWALYKANLPADSFYYPVYSRTFVLDGDSSGNAPRGLAVQPGTVLRVQHAFTHGFSDDFHRRVFIEKLPGLPEIEKHIHCYDLLSEVPTNEKNRFLSRVESFIVKGDADPSFVIAHSAERQAEWLQARGAHAL